MKNSNDLEILKSKENCKRESIISIPVRGYDNIDNSENYIRKVECTKTKVIDRVKGMVNLIDIDVDEVYNDFKIEEAYEKCEKLKSCIKELEIKFGLKTLEIHSHLEDFQSLIKNGFKEDFKSKIISNNHFNNNSKLTLNSLVEIYSNVTDYKNIPEGLKNEETILKQWINKEIGLKFEEILNISKNFILIDLQKVKILFEYDPDYIIAASIKMFYLKGFSYNQKRKFPSCFCSPWKNIPNDLNDICDLLDTNFLVHPGEFSNLFESLSHFNIQPYIGVTWPYRVVKLLSIEPNINLSSRYKSIGRVKRGYLYKLVFEEYNEVSQYIKYFVL